jgi:hypothetical protein
MAIADAELRKFAGCIYIGSRKTFIIETSSNAMLLFRCALYGLSVVLNKMKRVSRLLARCGFCGQRRFCIRQ